MPAAALVVHQARYYLAYGSHADGQLSRQGHAYLNWVTPWIVALTAVAFGLFLTRVARAWRTQESSGAARPVAALWLVTALGLVLIYICQELLEGAFAAGHPPSLAGVFGHGGLWSVPVAMTVAFAMTLLMRGAHAVVRFASRARVRSAPTRRDQPAGKRQPTAPIRLLDPLAASAAGRAPPVRKLIAT
ncbi:MAG: hypothetical protein JOZ25_03445 [Actinobacteria bacterium]|nr:hypothetical protein [Actinomycetota bacterium]